MKNILQKEQFLPQEFAYKSFFQDQIAQTHTNCKRDFTFPLTGVVHFNA
jgi:uncharacterized protein YqcC (DUF446 family)